jgi:hypothetical protein
MGNESSTKPKEPPTFQGGFHGQIEMIRQAPIPYLLALSAAVVFITFLVWQVFSFFYTTAMTGKDATIENLRTQLEEHKRLLEAAKDKNSQYKLDQASKENFQKYVCTNLITARTPGRHAAIIEFGVRGGTTSGFAASIQINRNISNALEWRASPLRTDLPPSIGGVTFDATHEIKQNVFKLSFSQPSLSPFQSEYVYIESENQFQILNVLYLENFNVLGDAITANALAKEYKPCPR